LLGLYDYGAVYVVADTRQPARSGVEADAAVAARDAGQGRFEHVTERAGDAVIQMAGGARASTTNDGSGRADVGEARQVLALR
jgi:hypothetical protein